MAAKKPKINPDQQRLLVLAVLVVCIIGYVYSAYIVAPLRSKGAALSEQIKTKANEVKQLDTIVGRLASFQGEHKKLLEDTAMWKERMPQEDQLPLVIETLSDYARSTGVRILIIMPLVTDDSKPSKKTNKASPADEMGPAYKSIPLQIDAEGSYHSLGKFINRIEQARNPMHVLSLRVSGSEKAYEHGIQLVIEAYFGIQEG